MNKTLSVLSILLLAVLAVAVANDSGGTTTFVGPRVAARVNRRNQTAPIPSTTIFTPGADGLFRMSASIVMTTPGLLSGKVWSLDLSWTDDAGTEFIPGLLIIDDTSSPPNDFGISNGEVTVPYVFRATKGHPVSYAISDPDLNATGTYALFLVIERLE